MGRPLIMVKRIRRAKRVAHTMEAEIVRVLREQKAALLAREVGTVQAMAARWMGVEQALQGEMLMTALEIQRMKEAGEIVTAGKIAKLERVQSLLAQAQVEHGRYITWLAQMVDGEQEALGAQGLNDARSALEVLRMGGATRVGDPLGRTLLPVEAIENMIGLAGDGSPVMDLLRMTYRDAATGLMQALINGIAKGLNPVEVARGMRNGFGMGYDRALKTARTEILRVYREASRKQYEESGIVKGYIRMSARDRRVCMACLMADGTFYPVGTTFEEHVCGRCTLAPVLQGTGYPGYVSGKEWFQGLDAGWQKELMGGQYFEAWQRGEYELDSLVKRVDNPVWGAALQVRPLGELVN